MRVKDQAGFLMKVKKIAGVLLSIVTVVIVLLLCVVLFWLGPTVKLVAEQVGSKALGTPLTINELSINPRSGIIHLSDFAIANPEQNPTPLEKDDPVTIGLKKALEEGRVQESETQEMAGYRQAGVIMDICRDAEADDDWDE